MKNKIFFLGSIFNLVCIFLIYIFAYITKNNHYALSIDTFFVASSIVILIFALIFKNKKVIFISLLSTLLGVGMNIFNISINYQKWLEREQPLIGDYYKNK